jgi:hypothetical protein
MNQAAAEKLISETEYLAFEEKSKIRHEFMDGEILRWRARRASIIYYRQTFLPRLNLQLRETNCEVYASDFRVKIREGTQCLSRCCGCLR